MAAMRSVRSTTRLMHLPAVMEDLPLRIPVPDLPLKYPVFIDFEYFPPPQMNPNDSGSSSDSDESSDESPSEKGDKSVRFAENLVDEVVTVPPRAFVRRNCMFLYLIGLHFGLTT